MSKDEIRAAVLRFYYEHNESYPGGMAQTHEVVVRKNLEERSVLEAQQYLIDKDMLSSREQGQQIRSMSQPGVRIYMARITSRGIDFVEHPRDFVSRGMPATLINIVANGNVHYAGGDQQIVGSNVSGTVAQGNASVSLATFPIEQLRTLLQNESDGLAAAETINSELVKPHPAWGKILGAAEIVKGVASVGEAGYIVSSWLSDPSVSMAIQHFLQSVMK